MAKWPHTDRQLLSWVRDDPEAFGVFYERYEAAVLAFFMRRALDAEVSADLAAETFAAALAHCRRQGPVDIAQPIAWLFAIARRKLIDSRRRGVVQDRARRALGMEHVEIGEETLEQIEALGADPPARRRSPRSSTSHPISGRRSGGGSSMRTIIRTSRASWAARKRSSADASAVGWRCSARSFKTRTPDDDLPRAQARTARRR
jgi:hypothetical protein